VDVGGGLYWQNIGGMEMTDIGEGAGHVGGVDGDTEVDVV
jgi:hypothetical protein